MLDGYVKLVSMRLRSSIAHRNSLQRYETVNTPVIPIHAEILKFLYLYQLNKLLPT